MEMSMFQLSGLGGLVLLALDIWALVNIFSSSATNGSKVLWALLVVLLPLLGFVIWFVMGPRGKVRHS